MPYLRPRPITVKEVDALAKDPGRHSVGDGLILNVGQTARGCSWTCRLRVPSGKRRDIGLGPYPEVTLAEARQRAADYRRMVRDNLDPLEERKKARRQSTTFRDAAEACWEERLPKFKNKKHGQQYITTLREYAYPVLADVPIADVDHSHAKEALKPIWMQKKETARRVLQRIADVCAWAVSEGLRETELPRNVVRRGLGAQKIKQRNFSAVPVEEAPAVYARLKAINSVASRALRFQILTALRPGVGRTARWEEMDFNNALWVIPAERMKMDEEHVVPLSVAAGDLFELSEDQATSSPFLFPSPQSEKKAISDTSLSKLQREIIEDATLHGWRSTFEDWAAEYTDFEEYVIDAAMAHKLDDDVKAAYRRTLFLEKRLQLMEAWSDFLEGKTKVAKTLDAAHRASKRRAA